MDLTEAEATEIIQSYEFQVHNVDGYTYIVDPLDNSDDGWFLKSRDGLAIMKETIEFFDMKLG